MNRTTWWTGAIPALMVIVNVACAGGGDGPDGTAADTAAVQPAFQLIGGQVPQFEPDPLHFALLPNLWVNGQVGGVAVDSHDNAWVFHRPATIPEGERGAALDPPAADCCIPAPSVIQYDADGQFVQAWGGPGEGYEWFENEHGIWVDNQDNVWLSGSAGPDNHILKFTSSGEFLMQIGHAGMNTGSNDTENVGGPAGLFVYEPTNELFVADGYGNKRVIVFDADTGAYKRHWGAYGNRPDDTVELPSRAEYVRQLAAGEPAPQQFNNPVHAVHVTNDGLVYVADRGHLRLQVFDLDGTFVREKFIRPGTLDSVGSVHGLASSPDPDQTFLYVADGANAWVHILDRATLDVVSRVGGRKGHNAREFFHLHSFASDSRGNFLIGEVNDGHRYYRWRFTGMGEPQNTTLPD
ncbi:MAG: hypothetical protein O2930_15750 [Acidobacteria bacterium]|nr:hypothetical protein [Acidobacteriota bacterium]